MSLTDDIRDHVNAGFAGIWIVGKDRDSITLAVATAASEAGKQLQVLPSTSVNLTGTSDTVFLHFAPRIPVSSAPAVVGIADWMRDAKQKGACVIFVAPDASLAIPEEWRCCTATLDTELPTVEELTQLALRIVTDAGGTQTESELHEEMAHGKGLTNAQAENAIALSLATQGHVDRKVIQAVKLQSLKRSGSLSVHAGGERFSDVAGFTAAKDFCLRSIQSGKGRGTLLLGVSGSGKSALAKSLGNELKRPCLTFDVGSLFGSLVGQTEERVRKALAVADAMAPCILFIDEIEKALGGTAGGGANDSGVSSRLLGTLLSWMQDHESDVYLIATANNIEAMPPELFRAERFDAVFFVDVPSAADQALIWSQYRKMFSIETPEKNPPSDQWTGAEIRQCCRNAQMLRCSLAEAAKYVVPVAVTAAEKTLALRKFASLRCIDAHRGGTYNYADRDEQQATTKPTRKVNRRAENN